MHRPLFVPDTPSAIHTVHGGSLSPTDAEKTANLGGAPLRAQVYRDTAVRVERFRLQTRQDKAPRRDTLRFAFTADQSELWLGAAGDHLHLYVGTALYQITPSSPRQIIELVTGHGADCIHVDDSLQNPVSIDAGAGDDYLRVGGRHSTILSGEGDDTLRISAEDCTVDSGPGNDSTQVIGAGTARIYAGDGADSIHGGAGLNFIDGGTGDDVIAGGSGHHLLSGGDGNDTIKAGSGTNVIYPGKGHDHVSKLKATDRVYSLPGDTLVAMTNDERYAWLLKKLASLPTASLEQVMTVLFPADLDTLHQTLVASGEAGKTGLSIGGNRQFAVRVESDLSVLRVSPNGQKLLHALDIATQHSGQPVSIEPGDENNARFTPSTDSDTLMIRDGQPGTPAYGGRIEYNPFFSPPGSLPIIGLYHELCHAYNAVTGTVAPGTTDETDGGKTVAIKNVERQAVGLPIDLAPFDFDLNPDTPPTRTNPEAFTENALRKEFGLPTRDTYLAKPQGD
ncbi:M91 family zinc metallopeptidase [Pseudomonas putida]